MTSAQNNTQGPLGPFSTYQHMLRERLQSFLDPLPTELRMDVMRTLQENGKLFDPAPRDTNAAPPSGSWALLTFLVALHIAPEMQRTCASSVAVALECLICALDLLDDVEDGDQTPVLNELGSARALNASTALLMLAQRSILSISQYGLSPAHILRLLDALQDSLLLATTGQQRDLLAEHTSAQYMTTQQCIEVAEQKAGSLMRLACRLGALVAEADDEICEQFSLLGQLLGIFQQLDNDCHDLYYLLQDTFVTHSTNKISISKTAKTDLVRGKKTLPIVLATQAGYDFYAIVSDAEKRATNQHALQEGIISAWGICLLYKERARDQLQKIEAQQPVSHALRLLLGFA